jgi:hypothetical protein
VSSVSFFTEPLPYLNLNEYALETSFTPIVQIVDSNGNGVRGKTPEVYFVDPETGDIIP